MARLTPREKLVVAGVALFFTVLFAVFVPWWLFVIYVVVSAPLFYRLLST